MSHSRSLLLYCDEHTSVEWPAAAVGSIVGEVAGCLWKLRCACWALIRFKELRALDASSVPHIIYLHAAYVSCIILSNATRVPMN